MGECRYNNPQTCWGQVHSWRNSTEVNEITCRAAVSCSAGAVLSLHPRWLPLLQTLLPLALAFPWGDPGFCFHFVFFSKRLPSTEDIGGLTGYVTRLNEVWAVFFLLSAVPQGSAARSWGSGRAALPALPLWRDLPLLAPNSLTAPRWLLLRLWGLFRYQVYQKQPTSFSRRNRTGIPTLWSRSRSCLSFPWEWHRCYWARASATSWCAGRSGRKDNSLRSTFFSFF